MKRLINQSLIKWMGNPHHKPLILRGARQVGKTHAARELGKKFKYFVEVNFEKLPQLKEFFQPDLNPKRIKEMLELQINKPIIPGETLLFLDEIQECPQAILALRYFYEDMPELHIIAAGSLLEFAIDEIGIPVGRVSFLYLYPMSFIEFLLAADKSKFAENIIHHPVQEPQHEVIHQQLLKLLGEYMLSGGMPEVVSEWINNRNIVTCQSIQHEIIEAYRQDFSKYARKQQIKYVDLIFNKVPALICQLFKYTHLESPYQKRELEPCLDLLLKANIVHKVSSTSANGIPLGADIDFNKFKLLFIDVALCQTMLGLTLKNWLLDPLTAFSNKGSLCEAFIGQELLAYSPDNMKTELYFWHRLARGSSAEIDYVIAQQEHVLPIEVKSGKGSTLKSLHSFLDCHPKIKHGVRFSTQNYSIYDGINSYPLYAAAALFADHDSFGI